MIDHVAARRLSATAIDGPIEASDASELDLHLAGCPACRGVSSALARDAAALRHLDLGPVPIAVRANVAIAAERGRSGPVGRWVGLVIVGALLVVALGSGALGGVGSGTGPDRPALRTTPVEWQTPALVVHASDLWLQTGDRRLVAASSPELKSEATNDSRSLEAVWVDQGQALALRITVVPVDGVWLVKGVQSTAGGPDGIWLDAQGPLIGSAIGAGLVGDVDLDLVDVTGPRPEVEATLHIRDLSLQLGATPPAPNLPLPFDPNQPAIPPTPIAGAAT